MLALGATGRRDAVVRMLLAVGDRVRGERSARQRLAARAPVRAALERSRRWSRIDLAARFRRATSPRRWRWRASATPRIRDSGTPWRGSPGCSASAGWPRGCTIRATCWRARCSGRLVGRLLRGRTLLRQTQAVLGSNAISPSAARRATSRSRRGASTSSAVLTSARGIELPGGSARTRSTMRPRK